MGEFCWAFTELSHMIVSFSVPIVDGKPLYTNEYIDPRTRRDATRTKLSSLVESMTSMSDDLPATVQPLVTFLVTKQKSLLESVRAGKSLDDLRDYDSLFSATLGDSEDWPAIGDFGRAASASPDCVLDMSG